MEEYVSLESVKGVNRRPGELEKLGSTRASQVCGVEPSFTEKTGYPWREAINSANCEFLQKLGVEMMQRGCTSCFCITIFWRLINSVALVAQVAGSLFIIPVPLGLPSTARVGRGILSLSYAREIPEIMV